MSDLPAHIPRLTRSGLTILSHKPIPHIQSGERSDTEITHDGLHWPHDSILGTALWWKRASEVDDYLNSSGTGWHRNEWRAMGQGLRDTVGGAAGLLSSAADQGPLTGAVAYSLPSFLLGGLGGMAYDSFLRPEGESSKAGLSAVMGAAIGAGIGGLSGYHRRRSAQAEEMARQYYEQKARESQQP